MQKGNITINITGPLVGALDTKGDKTTKQEIETAIVDALLRAIGTAPKIRVGPVMDRIKTFEDVVADQEPSVNSNILLMYNGQDEDMIGAQAFLKATITTRALNTDPETGKVWKPDWSNENQRKYYPCFKMSGFGFSRTAYDYWRTDTTVGSLLCFPTAELAEYAGRQFEAIYKDLLTIQ